MRDLSPREVVLRILLITQRGGKLAAILSEPPRCIVATNYGRIKS
jgi:hypothetical protein